MHPERSTQEIINQWCTMDEHADAAGISSKVVYTMFLAMRLLGNETIQIKKYVNLFRTILKKIYANVWMNW